MAFKKSYLFLSLSLISSLAAAPDWTGATDNFWTNLNNWFNPVRVPIAGDSPNFPDAVTSHTVDITGLNSSPTFPLITVETITAPAYSFTGTATDVINFDASPSNSTLTFNGTLAGTNLGCALSIKGGLDINSNNTAGTTISGIISETSSPSLINITGAGLLTLTGMNTYTGGTEVLPSGKLAISDNSSLGNNVNSILTLDNSAFFEIISNINPFTHQITLNGASTIFIDPSMTVTQNGPITGAGSFTKDGTGTLILAGVNNYSGGTTINAGTLAINQDGSLGAAGSSLIMNSGSTLQANASSTHISTHTITLAGSATFDTNGHTFNILSSITETGGPNSLTKIGAGTLILTGANSYTGDTNVNAGTLAINGDNNLGTVGDLILTNATLQANASTTSISSHIINLNGTSIFDSNSNILSVSSSITGGTLTKINPGTLILTGINSYAGATTVNGGTLAINSDASLGTANIGLNLNTGTTFRSDATFALSNRSITLGAGTETIDTNGNDLTIPGQISGLGGLIKNGAGTLILTGANIYGGGTTISAGTLQGNTTSLQGNITDNAALVFDQSSVVTGSFLDVISGSGSVALQGTGTLILANTGNNYTGGTTINGGVLQVSGAIVGPVTVNAGTFDVENSFTITDWTGAPGGTVFLGSGRTLTFGASNPTTVASAISGAGGLTKQGSGTVIFSGASTYTGPTQINAGTLVVNGSITSPTTVAAGATLKGTGTIASSLNVFGTVRPGNSVGTLNVLGPVTFNAGSTYAEELNPTQASLLNVTGGGVTINPNVTLAIMPNPGTYTPGSTYTIIQTAGGVVTGTFSTVTDSLPLLQFTVSYTPNTVVLNLAKKAGGFSNLVPSGNAGAVAKCLDSASPTAGSDFDNVLNQLLSVSSAETLEHDLNQLQPSQYNAFQLSQENNNTRILSVLSLREAQLHRACKPQEHTWGVWVDAYGDTLEQDHQQGQYGFHATSGAVLAGVDGQAACHLHLGLGGAYTWTSLDWAGSHGDGDISSGYGFAYGTWNTRHFFLDASFVGGYNNYEAKRHIDFLTIDRRAKSEHHGYTLAGRLTGGVPFKAWGAEIAPLISIDYDFVHQTSFKEHGAKSLNLHVHEKNANLLRGEAGFRVTRRCPPELQLDPCTQQEVCVSDARWLPSFQLTVIREWRFQGKQYSSRLQDLDCTFKTEGLNPDRTLIAPAVGITYLAGDRWEMTLDYAGEFDVDGKYWDQKANFQISYAF